VIQAIEDEMKDIEKAFKGEMISIRNEKATYTSLRNLLISRMNPEKAEDDRLKLGEMLLSDVSTSDRLYCALVIKVEERELLQSVLELVNQWMESLDSLGDSFKPIDFVESSLVEL